MKETTIATRREFSGRLINLDVLEVELEPGVRARREIVLHRGAVGILARTPDGRFVFVRQYRKPVEAELTEIIAGCLDPGETPEQAAVREIREETGYAVRRLIPLGPLLPSPGYTNEIIHLFMAELAPAPAGQQTEHDERIVVESFDAGEVERRMASGDIRDGKTLAAWMLYRLMPT